MAACNKKQMTNEWKESLIKENKVSFLIGLSDYKFPDPWKQVNPMRGVV